MVDYYLYLLNVVISVVRTSLASCVIVRSDQQVAAMLCVIEALVVSCFKSGGD